MSTVIAYLDAGTGSQIAALVAGGFAATRETLLARASELSRKSPKPGR